MIEHTDVIVVGIGTAGSIVAARYAELGASVLALEAGPDYGRIDSGMWPHELLDATTIPHTHDWGYTGTGANGQSLAFQRARVVGGCSVHNGCTQSVGWRGDYDAWGAQSRGWSSFEVRPAFSEAASRLGVRTPTEEEIQPFHRAFLGACNSLGIPRTDDLLELSGGIGVSISPVNIFGGTRLNTAVSYLDPHRESSQLRIHSHSVVESIEFRGNRAVGVSARVLGEPRRYAAENVLLCAGVYGTPTILMRSGIGAPGHLTEAGIRVRLGTVGVGQNLRDHPMITVSYLGTPDLTRALAEHARTNLFVPEEQTLAKLTSAGNTKAPYDHHLFGWVEPGPGETWLCVFALALLKPESTGHVLLDAETGYLNPLIDHRYLSEPTDMSRLLDVAPVLEELIHSDHFSGLLGRSVRLMPPPGPERVEWIRRTHAHYWHPTSTMRMGPANDPFSVVDESCSIHGLEGISVIDASVFPDIPRATTALPVAMLAERYFELTAP